MKEIICIVCPNGCRMSVDAQGHVTGNTCKRGESYAIRESTHPMRTLTTTVRLTGADLKRLPVKTREEIPKERLLDAMRALDSVTVQAPIYRGDVICRDIVGTGVDVIACRDAE